MPLASEDIAALQPSHYATLGLSRTTLTGKELKKQYRLLCLKYHPDRNLGNEEEAAEKFKKLQVSGSPRERCACSFVHIPTGSLRAGGVRGSLGPREAAPVRFPACVCPAGI